VHPLQSKFNLRSHKKQRNPKEIGWERGKGERERDGDRQRLADCILNPLNGLCLGVIGGNGSGSGSEESQMKSAGGILQCWSAN